MIEFVRACTNNIAKILGQKAIEPGASRERS
jgi:hypothetical protein